MVRQTKCILCSISSKDEELIFWPEGTKRGCNICQSCRDQCGSKFITGRYLEAEFAKGARRLRKVLDNGKRVPLFFVKREKDPFVFRGGMQKGEFDLLLISKHVSNHGIECKFSRLDRMQLDEARAPIHQIKALQKFFDSGGFAWVMLAMLVDRKIRVFLMPLPKYLLLSVELGRNEIHPATDIKFLKERSIELQRIKMKTEYYIDLSFFESWDVHIAHKEYVPYF